MTTGEESCILYLNPSGRPCETAALPHHSRGHVPRSWTSPAVEKCFDHPRSLKSARLASARWPSWAAGAARSAARSIGHDRLAGGRCTLLLMLLRAHLPSTRLPTTDHSEAASPLPYEYIRILRPSRFAPSLSTRDASPACTDAAHTRIRFYD